MAVTMHSIMNILMDKIVKTAATSTAKADAKMRTWRF